MQVSARADTRPPTLPDPPGPSESPVLRRRGRAPSSVRTAGVSRPASGCQWVRRSLASLSLAYMSSISAANRSST